MSTDLVPVDNMAELDTYTPHDREVAITGMLDQARTWLAHAVESSAPAQDIANFKAFIATAAETARRLKVSKEIQVDAEVMVRRSERALGQAIRGGQERGEIAANGERLNRGLPNEKTSADEFFSGGGETSDVYALTDDVTDADFNTALDRAQGEQNVSRANVVRKITEQKETKETSVTSASRLAMPQPPKYGGGRLKHNRIIENVTLAGRGMCTVLDEITELDQSITNEEAGRLAPDLSELIRSLKRIQTMLNRKATS